MNANDLSEFKQLFIDTARKQIEKMTQALSSLEKNQSDTGAMNILYIAAHSLKGESLALGYMTNASVSQLVEKIFHGAKDGQLTVTNELLSAVCMVVNKLSESIDCVEKEDKECIFTKERLTLEKISGIALT